MENYPRLLKVLKGAAIAAAGAALAHVTVWITDTDFGLWTPTVTAAWAILVNAARKWIMGQSDDSSPRVPAKYESID